jgi:hypothetical protein
VNLAKNWTKIFGVNFSKYPGVIQREPPYILAYAVTINFPVKKKTLRDKIIVVLSKDIGSASHSVKKTSRCFPVAVETVS